MSIPVGRETIAEHTFYGGYVVLHDDGTTGPYETGSIPAKPGGSVYGPWLLCPDATMARRINEKQWLCQHQLTEIDLLGGGVRSSPPCDAMPQDERTAEELESQLQISEMLAQETCQLMYGDQRKSKEAPDITAGDVRDVMRLAVALYRDAAPRIRQINAKDLAQGDIAQALAPGAASIVACVMPEPNAPLSQAELNIAGRLWRLFLEALADHNLAIAFGRDAAMPAGVYAIDLEPIPTGDLYQELGAWIYRAPQETTP